MATYGFEVRHTGRPFGPCELLEPRHYRHTASRHTTLSAARKAVGKYRSEMKQTCGQDAWDNHYAVFALHPVRLKSVEYCQHCGREMVEYTDWGADCIEPRIDMQQYCSAACIELSDREEQAKYNDPQGDD